MASQQTTVEDYEYSTKDPDETYRDKGWLYQQYYGNDLRIRDVAEKCGVSFSCVQRWISRLGIPPKSRGGVDAHIFIQRMDDDAMYREYVKKKKSLYQIADEHNVSHSLAEAQLERRGIERRSMREAALNRVPYCSIRVTRRGYVTWSAKIHEQPRYMAVHRLAAIAEYGVDAVKGNSVHHANGIPWLNVPVFDADIPELENPNLVLADGIAHRRAHHTA